MKQSKKKNLKWLITKQEDDLRKYKKKKKGTWYKEMLSDRLILTAESVVANYVCQQ